MIVSCTSRNFRVSKRSITSQAVVHEQALSSKPELHASELQMCDSWFSIRNDRFPPTHHSKCITFTKKKKKKKTANLWDDTWGSTHSLSSSSQQSTQLKQLLRAESTWRRKANTKRRVLEHFSICTIARNTATPYKEIYGKSPVCGHLFDWTG